VNNQTFALASMHTTLNALDANQKVKKNDVNKRMVV
jgi:hypothetical protein